MNYARPQTAQSATEAAERERLRAMTRELHEAAKDARAAARELRAERDATAAAAAAAVDAYVTGSTEALRATIAETRATVEAGHAQFIARLAELADTELSEEGMQAFMTKSVMVAVRAPEFVGLVVDAIADEIARDPLLMNTDRRRRMRAAAGGGVLVGTMDELSAFVRSGGDPGIVLDART
jgi:hypothetical protein